MVGFPGTGRTELADLAELEGGQARLDLEAARSELAAIRAARQAISAVLERERTAAALH
jgi:hypothetical protein